MRNSKPFGLLVAFGGTIPGFYAYQMVAGLKDGHLYQYSYVPFFPDPAPEEDWLAEQINKSLPEPRNRPNGGFLFNLSLRNREFVKEGPF